MPDAFVFIIGPLRPDAVSFNSLARTFAQSSVDMFVVVARTGRVESSKAGCADTQDGFGIANSTPLESLPISDSGLVADGALVNNPAINA
jgi:hypothetical protein